MMEYIRFGALILGWTVIMIFLAFLAEWFYRKLMGHIQHRVGPKLAGPIGILQPIADFIKLMNKEEISPEGTDDFYVDFLAVFGVWLMIFMSFLIPIVPFGDSDPQGLISFNGDAIFLLALFAMASLMYIITPYLFKSPYPTIGAGRRAELYLSYEIPMFLALASVVIIAGSVSMSDIIQIPLEEIKGIPVIILLLPAFIVTLIGVMARIKKLPFDIPEAKTELAAGWEAELSGRRLAFFNLLTDLKLFVGSAVIVTFFLGGPLGPMPFAEGWWWYVFWFLLKTFAVIFLITLIAGSVARFRIDQVLELFWRKLMPLSIIQIFIVLWAIW